MHKNRKRENRSTSAFYDSFAFCDRISGYAFDSNYVVAGLILVSGFVFFFLVFSLICLSV